MSRIVAWAAWFIPFWFLWLLLAGEWNRVEWISAGVVGAVAATLAEVARARLDAPLPPPRHALVQIAPALLAVVVDFGVVVWALVAGLARGRVARGAFTAHRRDELRGGDGAAARRRAWAALAATYSPNAYVVEIDPDEGSVLLHDLVRRRASERPA